MITEEGFILIADDIRFRSSPDVFLGYLLWAAGSFRESYVLSLSPIPANDTWVDTKLVTECLAR